MRKGTHIEKLRSRAVFFTASFFAAGQSVTTAAGTPSQSAQIDQPRPKEATSVLRQQLDVDSEALSKIHVTPLIQPDPLRALFQPIDRLTDRAAQAERLKLGATYTFLNQYATVTPESVRHNQLSGRLDFTGAWSAYQNHGSAGSISLLVRSGTNIGVSQQFNLSNGLGSGLTLNCLQGGGAQQPITLNILYWRQDLLGRRLSFYIGKIHPNQHIALSMFNDDETSQFLNGANDGNAAIAYNGTYAGGAAVEFQATPHLYIHAVAVDTEGAADRGLATLVDRKYMEAVEVGWFSGSLGQRYQGVHIGMWRDDTKSQGSGYGGGFSVEHEFSSGWAPFMRYALATDTGTSLKEVAAFGLTQVHPFGRHGDMFGTAFNYSEPSAGKHHESVFESFYRLRLTQSVDLGPDVEVSVHPTYASKEYVTTLLSARMRIIF
ncbi:MAG: carbohydrate porin [Edaphobacter sp.]|uniref:carbohydrate porin n=1 Tax=Edaphobacter sp. TaxID=1934404 RepID=UPI00239F41B0|nr:carbohydrate porin [Edaphobacter sp.]MDE1175684.1 carbohydrate porin [Edaphobacter sp.]